MTIVPGRPPNAVDPNDPEFVSYYDPGGTSRVGPKSSVDPGGGGSAGSPIVRKFPFAFDTPGILTGAALYTPTVGDILLDAWIEIDTAWDGTTPLGDIGTFQTGQGGWFDNALDHVDMTNADGDIQTSDGLFVAFQPSAISIMNALYSVTQAIHVNGAGPGLTQYPEPLPGERIVPGKFTAANPIKVVVSQDGTNTGADPGSTQGAAILYLVTCTPV